MEKKQILVVTNAITEEEVFEIRKAFQIDKTKQMKLNLVHVIPYLPTCYFNVPSLSLLVERYYDEARDSLHHVGSHLHIPKKDQWLITGKIRTEVLRLANKLNSSFILASAQQIKELQRSLFFKNIYQYALIKNVNQIEQLL